MEARDRRALKAVDDYLRDYCGEDAVRRWRDTLSESERTWLARGPTPASDAWSLLVEVLADLLQRISAAVSRALGVLVEALRAIWEALTGPRPRWLGGDAL